MDETFCYHAPYHLSLSFSCTAHFASSRLPPQTTQHGLAMGPKHRRRVHVINLDPAAEHFRYDVAFDIRRDLISVDDVMDELHLGPNGSLVYCMEYLLQNMDWLEERLDGYDDDEYLIFDCPGQIELYTHIPVMNKIIDQ